MGEALRDYQICLRIDPMFLDALLIRAEIHAQQGRDDLALQDLGKVLEREPRYCYAHQLRASIYKKQGFSLQVAQEIRAAKWVGCSF